MNLACCETDEEIRKFNTTNHKLKCHESCGMRNLDVTNQTKFALIHLITLKWTETVKITRANPL